MCKNKTVGGSITSPPLTTYEKRVYTCLLYTSGNLVWGIILMLLYSIGHSTLVMVAGTSVGFIQKINSSDNYKKTATILKIVIGAVILLIGLYMFWLAF